MEWIRVCTPLLRAVAWPIAVVVLAVLLRREIKGLLERRITLRRGDVSVEIDAKKLKEEVFHIAAELAEPTPQTGDSVSSEESLRRKDQLQELIQKAVSLGRTPTFGVTPMPAKQAHLFPKWAADNLSLMTAEQNEKLLAELRNELDKRLDDPPT